MLKYISVFESFCCMNNWESYSKKRLALQKCPIFLLERERERERERVERVTVIVLYSAGGEQWLLKKQRGFFLRALRQDC